METEWQYRILEELRSDGSTIFTPQEMKVDEGSWFDIASQFQIAGVEPRDTSAEKAKEAIEKRMKKREAEAVTTVKTTEHIYPPEPYAIPDSDGPKRISQEAWKWFGELWEKFWIWGKH